MVSAALLVVVNLLQSDVLAKWNEETTGTVYKCTNIHMRIFFVSNYELSWYLQDHYR